MTNLNLDSSQKEHPSFTRAKALGDPALRQHFPKTVEEAGKWEAHIRYLALDSTVLVVATTRIECAWSAYCDSVSGENHRNEWQRVLSHGSKLDEKVARALFPAFADVDYAS